MTALRRNDFKVLPFQSGGGGRKPDERSSASEIPRRFMSSFFLTVQSVFVRTAIIAFYNPAPAEVGLAVRYDLKSGKALEEWATPGSPRVTCPCLVRRSDGVKLLLTTATEGMPAEMRARCPNAGALFLADTPLSEVPPAVLVRLTP